MKSLLKIISGYTLTNILGAGLSFIMMSVLTFYLTPEDYGLIQLSNGIIKFFVVFISLGTMQFLLTKIYDSSYREQLRTSFTSFLVFSIVLSGIYILLTLGLYLFTDKLFNISFAYLWLMPVIALLTVIYEFLLSIFMYREMTRRYMLFNLIRFSGEFLLIVLLVMLLDIGWFGRILALFCCLLLCVGLNLSFIKNSGLFNRKVDFKLFLEDSKKGLPLVVLSFSILIFDISDRFFIEKMIGLKATGMYSVAYTYSSIVMLIGNAVINAIRPRVYQHLSKNDVAIKKLLGLNALILLVISLFIIFAKELVFAYLFDPQYKHVSYLTISLVLGFFFWGIYMFFNAILVFYNKNYLVALISLAGIFINLLLNYLLIEHMGISGASYATMFSCVFMLLLSFWFSYRILLEKRRQAIEV